MDTSDRAWRVDLIPAHFWKGRGEDVLYPWHSVPGCGDVIEMFAYGPFDDISFSCSNKTTPPHNSLWVHINHSCSTPSPFHNCASPDPLCSLICPVTSAFSCFSTLSGSGLPPSYWHFPLSQAIVENTKIDRVLLELIGDNNAFLFSGVRALPHCIHALSVASSNWGKYDSLIQSMCSLCCSPEAHGGGACIAKARTRVSPHRSWIWNRRVLTRILEGLR